MASKTSGAQHKKNKTRKTDAVRPTAGKHALSTTTGTRRPLVMASALVSATVFSLMTAAATMTQPTGAAGAASSRAASSLSTMPAMAASRSEARTPLAESSNEVASSPAAPSVGVSVDAGDGVWALSDEDLEVPYSKSPAEKAQDLMSEQTAKDIEELKENGEGSFIENGPLTLTADVVKELNKQYEGREPEGWDPNHATGDEGNAYSFSQCTWWAYKRRHELGLPAGSHMGDGRMWTGTGKSLGYWVDNTPHIGDAMSFPAGSMGSDPYYGHVAIVENVFEYEGKTYIKTSESGASYDGGHFSRIIGNPERFEYMHY